MKQRGGLRRACTELPEPFIKSHTKWRNEIMINMPEIKLGIVAVSRDCFPMTL